MIGSFIRSLCICVVQESIELEPNKKNENKRLFRVNNWISKHNIVAEIERISMKTKRNRLVSYFGDRVWYECFPLYPGPFKIIVIV